LSKKIYCHKRFTHSLDNPDIIEATKGDRAMCDYTAEYDAAAAKARLDAQQKRVYDDAMQALLDAHDAGAVLSDEAYKKLAHWI
jgi:hypothetical protein